MSKLEEDDLYNLDLNISVINSITAITYITDTSRGAGAPSVTVNRLVVGSILTRGDEIFT